MTNRRDRTRILRVITRLNVGGPARHVVWLTAALNDAEFETRLITGSVPPGEDDMSGFATDRGVHPVIIKEMSREISPADWVTIWKIYRELCRFRPDVVHTHTAKAGTVGRVAGLMYRYLTPSLLIGRPRPCRFIHTYHGHIFHSYYGRLKTRLFLAIERTLARIATDRILVLSPQQFKEIHRDFGIGREMQFAIVPLGIDINEIAATATRRDRLRAELRVEPDVSLVGIVGRLAPIKNHDLFLLAATRFGKDVRFAIFGDGSEREVLERRVAELKVGDRVHFAGVREPADIYSAIDVLALTSLNEGTPLAVIEAMANGIPIVSTAVGGVIDLLGAVEQSVDTERGSYQIRERGITASSMDEEGFSAALARIVSDPDLKAKWARPSRDFVADHYSKDRLVADIIRVTRDLAS